MSLTKKEQDFLDQMVTVIAEVGQMAFENMIQRKQDSNRLELAADMEQRLADQQAQEALEKRIKAERIVKYYAHCLNRPSFAITEANLIDDEPIDTTQNLWHQAFLRFGNYATSNPFYRLDLEQKLFFIGVTDVRLNAVYGQMDALLPYWFDHEMITLNDVMAEFVPIEETDPELTFVDQIESIRERLIAKRQTKINERQAIEDGLTLVD